MENEDNIQFESMPDWGEISLGAKSNGIGILNPKPQQQKEYASLYEELLDKCYPGNYKDGESECFNLANEIYGQLKQNGDGISNHALRYLRNRAIDELGVQISTTKTYSRLKSLIDPENFIKIEPYNKDLVEKAKMVYDQLKANKNDIRALEQLESHPDTKSIIDEYYFSSLTPDEYLKNYPTGRHSIDVKKRLMQEEETYFNENAAWAYLQKYPLGRYREEASCYIDDPPRVYLKRYPNGRYNDLAQKDRRSNLFLIGFLSIIVIGGIVLTLL